MNTNFQRMLVAGMGLAAISLALGNASAQSTPETWQVTVDIFSGRPNPTFTVTGADLTLAKSKANAARAVAAASAGGVRPSILGYRGMIIAGSLTAEVYKGKILRKSGTQATLEDTSMSLEKHLLAVGTASKAIPPEAVKVIQRAIP